jgi:hypothetical protein
MSDATQYVLAAYSLAFLVLVVWMWMIAAKVSKANRKDGDD